MRVTKIERRRRDPGRVSIYLDGTFAFGLHTEVLSSAGLRTGDELDSQGVERLLAKEEFALARSCAQRYLRYRRRTVKELHDRLIQQEFTPHIVEAVTAHLRELHLLDDAAFARAFVHDAQLQKASGRRLLRHQLRRKGVPPAIIEDILTDEVPEHVEQELAVREARKFLKRGTRSRPAVEERKQQERLARHLIRRGFGWEMIRPVIVKMFRTHDTSSL